MHTAHTSGASASHTGDYGDYHLSTTERAMSGAAGTLLGLWALRHGGVVGVLGALAGGALLARAATGHNLMSPSEVEHEVAETEGWRSAAVTEEAVTIDRPKEQLYAFWRDFSNLPRVMSHVSRVEVRDRTRSHWVIELPMGKQLAWTSSITEDHPNRRIAWRAQDDAQIPNSGWVEFREAPGGQGTEVRVQIAYEPPAGEVGRIAMELWPQSPGTLLKNDLQEFKRRVESGETVLPSPGSVLPG